MKLILKWQTIIVISSFFICIFICWKTSAYITKQKLEVDFSNVELYELASDQQLSAELDSKTNIGSTELNNRVVANILTVAGYHPAIESLQGTPLKTLCQIIYYERRGGFSSSSDSQLKQYAIAYLESVSQKVFEQIAEKKGAYRDLKQSLINHGINKNKLEANTIQDACI